MAGMKVSAAARGARMRGVGRATLVAAALALLAWHAMVRDRWAAMSAAARAGVFSEGQADAWHSAAEKAAVLRRLRGVLAACGTLCDTTRAVRGGPRTGDGLHFGVTEAPVSCRGLYAAKEVDAVRETAAAPKGIPEELLGYFSMDGRVSVKGQSRDQVYPGKEERVLQWDAALVDGMVEGGKVGRMPIKTMVGVPKTHELIRMLKEGDAVKGKRVLVIGSEAPWVEACALAAGAAEVVTLESSAINSTHPQVRAIVPRAFADEYLSGRLEPFDAVVSWSSLEHVGLARYGDALNPWGDIIAVAKAWCVTKPGGKFLMQVPYAARDQVVFNAHRVYGPVRTPYQMTNWRQVSKSEGIEDSRMYERLDAEVF